MNGGMSCYSGAGVRAGSLSLYGTVILFSLVLLFSSACGGKAGSTRVSAESPADNTAVHPGERKQEPVPAQQAGGVRWNIDDLDVTTNGNILVAVNQLGLVDAGNLEQQAESVSPAAVMKAPWKYYGKVLKLWGEVGIIQDYPPGSEIAQMVGGDVGEIVMLTADSTVVDSIQVGGTGDINVGDVVTIYGFVVGQVELDNQLGGMTTQLVVVSKVVRRGVD